MRVMDVQCRWRVVLGRLLTVVYHQIYGSADAETVVSQQVSRKRKFSAVDALEENFVEVHFTEGIVYRNYY